MELISKNLCLTGDVGVHGNLFGGTMMGWLDLAGAIFSCEKCQATNLVTKKMNVEFVHGVKVGDIIHIYGDVVKIGSTSITIKLLVKAIDVETGEEEVVCETEDVIFVRINPKTGKKRKISERVKANYPN